MPVSTAGLNIEHARVKTPGSGTVPADVRRILDTERPLACLSCSGEVRSPAYEPDHPVTVRCRACGAKHKYDPKTRGLVAPAMVDEPRSAPVISSTPSVEAPTPSEMGSTPSEPPLYVRDTVTLTCTCGCGEAFELQRGVYEYELKRPRTKPRIGWFKDRRHKARAFGAREGFGAHPERRNGYKMDMLSNERPQVEPAPSPYGEPWDRFKAECVADMRREGYSQAWGIWLPRRLPIGTFRLWWRYYAKPGHKKELEMDVRQGGPGPKGPNGATPPDPCHPAGDTGGANVPMPDGLDALIDEVQSERAEAQAQIDMATARVKTLDEALTHLRRAQELMTARVA